MEIDINEVIERFTVSGGDNVALDDTKVEESNIQTVSGNDAVESASTIVYVIDVQRESEIEPISETEYTIFDKPIESYDVSEGLLLIIALCAVLSVLWGIIKWAFSWFGW